MRLWQQPSPFSQHGADAWSLGSGSQSEDNHLEAPEPAPPVHLPEDNLPRITQRSYPACVPTPPRAPRLSTLKESQELSSGPCNIQTIPHMALLEVFSKGTGCRGAEDSHIPDSRELRVTGRMRMTQRMLSGPWSLGRSRGPEGDHLLGATPWLCPEQPSHYPTQNENLSCPPAQALRRVRSPHSQMCPRLSHTSPGAPPLTL